MLNKQTLISMLKLQDEVNTLIDPHWRQSGNPFLRAAMMESAEAVDHHGWKWWKHQAMDLAQLQLEMIDIWHFLLSKWIASGDGAELDVVADRILSMGRGQGVVTLDGNTFVLAEMSLLDRLELQVGLYACKRADIGLFESIITSCGMSWDDVASQYIGKNALNIFRQRNGYKAGTYQKIWFGKEDNEHMLIAAKDLDMGGADVGAELIRRLDALYLEVVGAAMPG